MEEVRDEAVWHKPKSETQDAESGLCGNSPVQSVSQGEQHRMHYTGQKYCMARLSPIHNRHSRRLEHRSYGSYLRATSPPTHRIPESSRSGSERGQGGRRIRSEEHTSELQSLMRISYAVFCLKKKKKKEQHK